MRARQSVRRRNTCHPTSNEHCESASCSTPPEGNVPNCAQEDQPCPLAGGCVAHPSPNFGPWRSEGASKTSEARAPWQFLSLPFLFSLRPFPHPPRISPLALRIQTVDPTSVNPEGSPWNPYPTEHEELEERLEHLWGRSRIVSCCEVILVNSPHPARPHPDLAPLGGVGTIG